VTLFFVQILRVGRMFILYFSKTETLWFKLRKVA